MQKEIKAIQTNHAPLPIGPYSQAILAGDFLYVSGQIAINPQTNSINENDVQSQTHMVFKNLQAILHAAELSMDDVVKVEVYLKDLEHFRKVNDIYKIYFSGPVKPARQAMQVSKLPLDALIEISCVAYAGTK